MKKTVFFMIILAIFATGCKKQKSKSLDYSGSSVITIALKDSYKLQAQSDYDISYNTSNNMYVTVSSDGVVYGKNVGSADISISNGYESKTITVKVDLFIEPTFEFGCSPSHIKELYGDPLNATVQDTILAYQYSGSQGYSYACGEMDFFFNKNQYIESDVYVRPTVEYLLNVYLNENFTAYDTLKVYNPYIEDSTDAAIFINKLDNNVICGKYAAQNDPWNEWLLFYFHVDNSEKDLAKSLKIRPRSSKLRY